jgi:hypothetical protein
LPNGFGETGPADDVDGGGVLAVFLLKKILGHESGANVSYRTIPKHITATMLSPQTIGR